MKPEEIVAQFLQTYAVAFEGYNAAAIAEHFALPCHIASDSVPAVTRIDYATAEECQESVSRILSWHRTLKMKSGRVLNLSVVEMSPRMICFDLHYELTDDKDERLYDYRGFYTLITVGERWKIAAISHNQVPRLLACIEARR